MIEGISRHGDRTPASYFPQMEIKTPVVWNCSLEQFETPVSYSDSWMYNTPSRLFRRVYLPDVEVLPGNCYFGNLHFLHHSQNQVNSPKLVSIKPAISEWHYVQSTSTNTVSCLLI